ncbi:inorganic pyrophosphatase, putative [Plasmodium ovale wallikeri]|uniref:inorganic diphosphatase n=1 Tax=Plasmodium ovale wallikeri TaxID=864142 RepID=A0A1A8YS87_PLAOA|nr:inorganic pyrophosphatase, putative [Plasmodium ovale wallikeri]SBT34850.1 inorganic pyrophosphatase, putative [Plasmodium ovale wallikeri]
MLASAKLKASKQLRGERNERVEIRNIALSVKKRKMSSVLIKSDNGKVPHKELKNEYSVETNNELKVDLNFHNNNIISNIFSNLSLYDHINNIFTINNKTYMLKYCNQLNQEDFHIAYFEKVNEQFIPISPWHDISLMNEDGTYNMIVEITKYNYIKLEIKLTEKFNVIKQDTKKGKLRYYHNSIYWNYGALPKTYEYPKHIYTCQTKDKEGFFFTGDDDPLDIVDVGQNNLKMGQIVPVKVRTQNEEFRSTRSSVLSILVVSRQLEQPFPFTLIDEGQLDWKIIAINVKKKKRKKKKKTRARICLHLYSHRVLFTFLSCNPICVYPFSVLPSPPQKYDKNFANIDTLEDVEKYYPYTLNLLLEWFRSYKMAESKKLNIISKKLYNKQESEDLIKKTHEYYREFLHDVRQLPSNRTGESTCEHSTSQGMSSSECIKGVLIDKAHDEYLHNCLTQDMEISYYKPDTSYKPNESVWIPQQN